DEREGIRVLAAREVARIWRNSAGYFNIETEGHASEPAITTEKILLATGRRPALDQLGLAAAGMDLDAKGRLDIGEEMRVKGSQHIFAAGDVAGGGMVVHDAHIEAGLAHAHTAHQLEDAEFYHPTKMEIVSEIGDALCRKLGGHPFARAEE